MNNFSLTNRYGYNAYDYQNSEEPSSEDDERLSASFARMRTTDSSTTADLQKSPYFKKHEIELKLSKDKQISPKIVTEQMDVRSIAFSQSSVSSKFSNGCTLEDTVDQLISGELSLNEIPPIRIVKYNNQWITLDNRRLRVFLNAAFIDQIPVIKCSLKDEDIKKEFWAKKNNKSLHEGGTIRINNSSTSSGQHFSEGIFVFNKRVLNWNVQEIQNPMPSYLKIELPDFFTSREEYYKSFEELIFEEARAILQNGSDQVSLDQTPLLTLCLTKEFKGPKDPQNPAKIEFKITKNEGQELRPAEAFLLVNSDHTNIQLIGLSNYTEAETADPQLSLKVVVDQSDLANFPQAFMSDQKWYAKSIGSLITLQRMYESCTAYHGREETPLEKWIWSGGKKSSSNLINYPLTPLSKEEEELLSSLNSSQYQPMKEFLEIKEGLKMVQGPPGTGKTTTVSKLLTALAKRGERVLVCASSNKGAQTLAEICLKNCPEIPMILIGVEKKLPVDGALHPIFLDLWGERQIQALNDLSQDLWKFQMTEILKGEPKFLKQRVNSACEKLRQKQQNFQAFTYEVLPYCLTCFEDILERNEWFQERVKEYCDFLESLEPDHWKEALLYDAESLEIPVVVHESRQCISDLTTMFSSLLMKVQAAAEDQSKNGLEAQLLNHSQIIFSTLSTSGQQRLKEMKSIDSLIIDEAGQSLEAETIIPLRAKPKKCLLVGDIQQLPATVFSREAEKMKFGRSMMERLSKDCKVPYSMLKVQYRMHPEICSFPSQTFYDGLLENHHSVHTPPLPLQDFLAPYAFINIQGQEEKGSSGHSFKNEAEVKNIQIIVDYLHAQKIDVTKRVGVITFYKAQADRIRDALKKKFPGIVVNTVDGFQGGECDFIIISCVRANPKQQIGFLDEYRRLNVALTRAKISLIVLGHAEALNRSNSNLALLVSDAKERKVLHSGEVLQQLIPKKVQTKPTYHHQIRQTGNNQNQRKTPIIGIQPKNPNYKTELCRYFMERPGSCKRGEKCQYAHGQGELSLK